MAETPQGNNAITWRALNREGCEMGRATKREVLALSAQLDKLTSKLDKVLWALVATSLGFVGAAVGLLLNLA